jgi:hypothetical protein
LIAEVVKDAKMYVRPDLLREPYQDRLCLVTEFVPLKRRQTQAQERKTKPVFPGIGILIDITARPERRQNPVNITGEQHRSSRQIGHSE